ncbi:hypothetical protein P3S67_022669 [Capsicum chacoense]
MPAHWRRFFHQENLIVVEYVLLYYTSSIIIFEHETTLIDSFLSSSSIFLWVLQRKMELSQADYIYDFSDELDDDSPFNFKGSHSIDYYNTVSD